MNVPESVHDAPQSVLDVLASEMEALTPELRKAAVYVLENPNDISVSSIREIAAAANVKPNTFVRMARSIGFDGYDDFRTPFREEIRKGQASFPDRARWLQSLSKGGKLSGLYADMAASAIGNIERTFADTDANRLKQAADAIVDARKTYVLGVGINHTLAEGFAYLAAMALESVETIPRNGGTAIDDLARADQADVLVAMTTKPYRAEVVEAVNIGLDQGMTVVAISDSPASPIVPASAHAFIVHSDTPQFFPSSVAISALLETLVAFVIADAKPKVIANIENLHARRQRLGIYVAESETR